MNTWEIIPSFLDNKLNEWHWSLFCDFDYFVRKTGIHVWHFFWFSNFGERHGICMFATFDDDFLGYKGKNEDEIDNWFCLPPETLQLILLIDFGYFNSNMSSYGYNPVVIQNLVGLLSSRTSAGSNLSSKLVAHFISIL